MTKAIKCSHPVFNMLFIMGLIFILYILKPVLVPLLIATVLSIMVFPLQKRLEKKWRCRRLFATVTSIVIIFTVTFSFLFLIYTQFQGFLENGDDYASKISDLYAKSVKQLENNFKFGKNNLLSRGDLDFKKIAKNNVDKIGTFVFESGSLFSDLVLIPIYIFFFLYYRKFFRIFAYKLFRNKQKSLINIIIKKIYNIQRNYLLGLVKVILIVGVLNTLGLLALGIKNPIFLGFFAAILLLIPYIGIIIGSLIPAVIALATKDTAWYAFGVIAIFGFIQFLEGNFITPKITGSKVSINAFVAILSLIVFSNLWGISGMILALPITASLKIIFDYTPVLKPYGYLIGEPEDKVLKSAATLRLNKWKQIRITKKLVK